MKVNLQVSQTDSLLNKGKSLLLAFYGRDNQIWEFYAKKTVTRSMKSFVTSAKVIINFYHSFNL